MGNRGLPVQTAMTTEQRLTLIRAKCVELLAIAEKRTPGEWIAKREYVDTIEDGPVLKCNDDSGTYAQDAKNSAFIASCAVPAEAGWRATIATLDWLRGFQENVDGWKDYNGYAGAALYHVRHITDAIISAWPESLLK